VVFYVDGKLKATDTTAAYAFVWNTAGLAKQVHTVTAKAYDRAGNVTSVTIRVRVR
jgi:leucyl aminopeptidase